MDRFTPGPWHVDAVAPDAPEALLTCGFAIMAGEEDVAYVSPCEDGERAANTRLIAAAPEMLAALQKAAEVMGWMLWDQSDRRDKNKAYTLVKDAIRTATGA